VSFTPFFKRTIKQFNLIRSSAGPQKTKQKKKTRFNKKEKKN